ncbi:amidohydrolase family protein [Chelatococcus sp. GCM10030263]|uniref:amidohydrolase family protein n=1 Tax=Chelatococcus sp. GCM10030263 TaxID=3273387 RepID=UPI0036071C86
MNIQATPTGIKQAGTRPQVIDCDIHPLMRKPSDIKAHLSQRWQQHFDEYGNHYRQPFAGSDIYPKISPYISRRDAYPPAGGPPGSDLAFMREQHLDPHGVELGVLQVLAPTGANQRNVDYGAALCSGLNDWQIAAWTSAEPRLKASILVTQEYAEAAVAEIERRAGNPDFVQVSVSQRSLEPLGRRRYWPIYAAAEEAGLAIGIHSGGNNGHPPVPGGGWCSYYVEQHHLISLGMQALVTSFVMEGVFEKFPKLRIILIEGGFSWLPALTWRLDKLWAKLRSEVPQVKRPPSEYIREHCWFSTQPMEEVDNPAEMRRIFDWIGWDRLVYSSDYPHWDYDDPRHAFPFKLDERERKLIFEDNARAAFALH